MVEAQMQDHQEVSSVITVQAREDMGDPLEVVDTRTGTRSGRGISLRKHNDTYRPNPVGLNSLHARPGTCLVCIVFLVIISMDHFVRATG
jgi:hypothetical protein